MAAGPNEIVLKCTEDVVKIGEDCYIKVRDADPGEPVTAEAETLFTTCKDCIAGDGGVPPETDTYCMTTWTVSYNCATQTFIKLPPGATTCGPLPAQTNQWVKIADAGGKCTYSYIVTGSLCSDSSSCDPLPEPEGEDEFPDINDCTACGSENNVCEYLWEVSWDCTAAPGQEAGTVTKIDTSCVSPGTTAQDWYVYNPATDGGTACYLRKTTIGETCSSPGNCSENLPPSAPTSVPGECGCGDVCIDIHTYTHRCDGAPTTFTSSSICGRPSNNYPLNQWYLKSTNGTECVIEIKIPTSISCDPEAPTCGVPSPIDPPDNSVIESLCNCLSPGQEMCIHEWEVTWDCAASSWMTPIKTATLCEDPATLGSPINQWIEGSFDPSEEEIIFTYFEVTGEACAEPGFCDSAGSPPTLPAPPSGCQDACYALYEIQYNCDTFGFSGVQEAPLPNRECFGLSVSEEWFFHEKIGNVCYFRTWRRITSSYCSETVDCAGLPGPGLPLDNPSPEVITDESGCDCDSQSPQCIQRWEVHYDCGTSTFYDPSGNSGPSSATMVGSEVCDDATKYETNNWQAECSLDTDGRYILYRYSVAGITCASVPCDGTGHTPPTFPTVGQASSLCDCPETRCYKTYVQEWNCATGAFSTPTAVEGLYTCEYPNNVQTDTWIYDESASTETTCAYIYYVGTTLGSPCSQLENANSFCDSRSYASAPSTNPEVELLQQTCTCFQHNCHYSYSTCDGVAGDDIFIECENGDDPPPQYVKANGLCYTRGEQTFTPAEPASVYTNTYQSCPECAGPYSQYTTCTLDQAETLIFNVDPDTAQTKPYVNIDFQCYKFEKGTDQPPDKTFVEWNLLPDPGGEENCLEANNYILVNTNCDGGGGIGPFAISNSDLLPAARYIKIRATGECAQVPLLSCATGVPKVDLDALGGFDYRTGPSGVGQPDYANCQECIDDLTEFPSGGGGPPGGGGDGSLSSTGDLLGSEITLPSDGGIGDFSEIVTPETSGSQEPSSSISEGSIDYSDSSVTSSDSSVTSSDSSYLSSPLPSTSSEGSNSSGSV